MVPFWAPRVIRHLYYFGYPKRDFNVDNYPHITNCSSTADGAAAESGFQNAAADTADETSATEEPGRETADGAPKP